MLPHYLTPYESFTFCAHVNRRLAHRNEKLRTPGKRSRHRKLLRSHRRALQRYIVYFANHSLQPSEKVRVRMFRCRFSESKLFRLDICVSVR
jgi:hypothetical protein